MKPFSWDLKKIGIKGALLFLGLIILIPIVATTNITSNQLTVGKCNIQQYGKNVTTALTGSPTTWYAAPAGAIPIQHVIWEETYPKPYFCDGLCTSEHEATTFVKTYQKGLTSADMWYLADWEFFGSKHQVGPIKCTIDLKDPTQVNAGLENTMANVISPKILLSAITPDTSSPFEISASNTTSTTAYISMVNLDLAIKQIKAGSNFSVSCKDSSTGVEQISGGIVGGISASSSSSIVSMTGLTANTNYICLMKVHNASGAFLTSKPTYFTTKTTSTSPNPAKAKDTTVPVDPNIPVKAPVNPLSPTVKQNPVVSPTTDTGVQKNADKVAAANKIILKPTPNILDCSSPAKTLYFENDLPAYNKFSVSCNLGGRQKINNPLTNNSAIVWAKVYKKSFDPKKDDNIANEIKTVWIPKQQEEGSFTVNWDGFDDYDQPVAMGEYVFMVGAKINATYKTDQSIIKFKIENAPIETVANTNLHGAADKNSELSKCPGIYYPSDIAGNRSEAEIKEAYDKCIINSVEENLFQPNSQLTRAEAIKIIVLAIGKKAVENCNSDNCGSPFGDVNIEQSAWIKAAWDAKIINENPKRLFFPNRKITKAESYSMIVKAWNIKPHERCYTPDCGAGHPKNIFKDVKQAWQGPYLRALWDLGVIEPVSKNKIYPDSKPTRASFIKLVIDVEKKQGK